MSAVEETLSDLTEIVEDTAKIATDMGDASGIYVSKAGMVRLGVLGGLVLAGVGFAAYKIAEKKLETKYEKLASKEIEDAKVFYGRIAKKPASVPEPTETVEETRDDPEVMEDAVSALKRYQRGLEEEDSSDIPEEPEVQHINVFTNGEPADPNFNYEAEMIQRTSEKPYVISEEEFLANENDWSQTTITYYAGDGALADEQDREIPTIDPIIGESNLERFGDGTGDKDTVFIRNERLETEFEVVRSDGKYAHEVLGLQHSSGWGDESMRRRTRSGDDE